METGSLESIASIANSESVACRFRFVNSLIEENPRPGTSYPLGVFDAAICVFMTLQQALLSMQIGWWEGHQDAAVVNHR